MKLELTPDNYITAGAEEPKAAKPENSRSEPEKTPNNKVDDFAKMNPDEKADRINEVLANSAELASAYQDIELEVAGGRDKVKEQVKLGWGERFKIWRAGKESKTGQEIEFRKIAEIAHQEVNKKLGEIEQIDGQQLKSKKTALAAHEKNSNADLKNLENLGLHSESEIADIKTKLTGEREGLNQDVETGKEKLRSKLLGYSDTAEYKERKLGECAAEYKGYYDIVAREITTVRGNIAKYERGLASLKLEGGTAEGYKKEIRQAIDKQKDDLAKLEASQEVLKQRLDAVKANKSQVDAYLERINNIGKTDTEIRAEKAEKQRKERGAREAGRAPAGGVTPARERAEEEAASSEETDELAGEAAEARQIEEEPAVDSEKVEAEISPVAGATARVAATAAPEQGPQPRRRAERGEITRQASYWLNRIFKIMLVDTPGDMAETIMKKYFKVGANYERTAPMTLSQAIRAYTGYLIERKRNGMNPNSAEKAARVHFKRIFKDEENILREIDAAADRSADASEPTEIVPPLADSTAVAEPTAKAGGVNKQARVEAPQPAQTAEVNREDTISSDNKGLDGLDRALDQGLVGATPKAEGGGKSGIEAEPKAGADVPLINNRDVGQQLADFGMSKKDTGELKPEDAQRILNSKDPKAEITAVVAPTAEAVATGTVPEKVKPKLSTRDWVNIFGLKVNKTLRGLFISSENEKKKFNMSSKMTEEEAVGKFVELFKSSNPDNNLTDDEVKKMAEDMIKKSEIKKPN